MTGSFFLYVKEALLPQALYPFGQAVILKRHFHVPLKIKLCNLLGCKKCFLSLYPYAAKLQLFLPPVLVV